MDYKEKYEMALEGIQEILGSGEDSIKMSRLQLRLQGIFPELKESEDERIRKGIIDFLWKEKIFLQEAHSSVENNPKYRFVMDAIAWLEKQGENISLPNFTFDDVLALQCVMETTKKVQEDKELYEQLQSLHDRLHDAYWLEKQGEQKPAWSEEDENNLERAIWYVENPKQIVIKNSMLVEWLKSLKGRVQPQPKQERSEEDEKMLSDIVKDLVHPWNEYIPDRIEDEIKWLKNRLKSPRPQSTWKPSDEQMKALADALSLAKNCGEENTFDLRTLHEQLKKLRED